MTVTQASLAVVGAMVLVVVVVAALEVHTPAPRRRATRRLMLPRVIEGTLEDLPVVDFAGVGRIEPLPPVERRESVPSFEVAAEPGSMPAPVEMVDLTDLAGEGAPEEPVEEAVEVRAIEETVEAAEAEPTVEVEEPITELVPVIQMETWAGELVAGAEVLLGMDSQDVGPPTEPVETVAVPARPAAAEEEESSLAEAGAAAPPGAARGDRGTGSTVWVVGVDAPDGAVVELGEPGSDRDLAGLLFAAYVVGGGAERSRVTGWVTAKDAPPSQPAMTHGTKLRGRPSRIRDLLGCTDEDRSWVTLDPSVDIRRGVQRRAPVDPVLIGLLRWWSATTDADARVPAEAAVELGDAIEAVLDTASVNPTASTARKLAELARRAGELGAGLRIESLSHGAMDARRARADAGHGSADAASGRRLVGSGS